MRDWPAIWGCGPVGQFAIKSAWMPGAGRVIAIDSVYEQLELARSASKAEIINLLRQNVYEYLQQMTQGRGPDRCIDAVGCEAHAGPTLDALLDRVKSALSLTTDRAHVLREAIMCCRKGGGISVPGAYVGCLDKIPFGVFMNKGLTMKSGQTHMQRYMRPLLKKIAAGEIDPTFIITHRVRLADAPSAYATFRDNKDDCIKVVITP